MKNLVAPLLIALMVTVANLSFAQTFGIKAGINLANMLFQDGDEVYSDEFKSAPGFIAGATVEKNIKNWLSIESGLMVSLRGFKTEDDGGPSSSTRQIRTSLNYLEIPIKAKGYYELKDNVVYGLFGPYLGLGISGKKVSKYEGGKDVYKYRWGKGTENDLKRPELGIIIGGGVMLQRIQIELSYTVGLSNISTYTSNGTQMKNRYVALTAGYRFGDTD